MLKVLFACFRNLLAHAIGRKRFHTGAQKGLTAEERGVGLSVREHDHVSVVNPVTLSPVLIF